jgi:hypothetical protein
LAEQIWAVEDELCCKLAVIMPLQARLTRERGLDVYGRDDKERLREIIGDTRPRAFVLRQRSGGRVYARTPFWSHRPTACGIDHLHDMLGCDHDVAAEGRPSSFDTFVEQLAYLRQLRRSYCGMIKNGLDAEMLWADCSGEAWLNRCFLNDDIDSAVERLAKEVEQLSAPAGSESDRLFNRRWFDHIADSGGEFSYEEMLEDDERLFWEALGAPSAFGWRCLVAMVHGLPENLEEVISDVPDTKLAPVIPIKPRHASRQRSRVVAMAR